MCICIFEFWLIVTWDDQEHPDEIEKCRQDSLGNGTEMGRTRGILVQKPLWLWEGEAKLEGGADWDVWGAKTEGRRKKVKREVFQRSAGSNEAIRLRGTTSHLLFTQRADTHTHTHTPRRSTLWIHQHFDVDVPLPCTHKTYESAILW